MDFQGFLQLATQFGRTASKHQLEQATTIFTRCACFKFRREPRYGSINNDFTGVELWQFLRNVHNVKFLFFSDIGHASAYVSVKSASCM